MWLKHQNVYYNLDRVVNVSFRKGTVAFNLKTASYIQVPTRFPLSGSELSFIREMFESSLSLGNDLFDMDALYEKLKSASRRITPISS